MASINTSARAFLLSSNALNIQGQGVANSYTNGRFADQISWQEISVAGKSSGIEQKMRLEANLPLPISATDHAGDLAIDGEGMLIIKKAGGDTDLFVKTGSFHINKDGELADFDNILQGYAVDDAGNAITDKTLPINIDRTSVSEAEATTEIKLGLKLNADTIASGKSGMLFRESSVPGAVALRGSGIVINKMESPKMKAGVPSSYQLVLQYGGFIETDSLTSATAVGGAITSTDVAINIELSSGHGVETRELKVNIANNDKYEDALQIIADEINNSHSITLGAKILKDSTKSSLFVYSKDINSQITLIPTSELQTVFNNNFQFNGLATIPSADEGIKRFATLEQFHDVLKRNEFSVSFIGMGKKDTLFLRSDDDEMINIKNQDSSVDTLSYFGVPTFNQGTLEPIYSYLDSRYNLAGGNNSVDYQERVSIFDSKGGKKDLTFAFKKISATSWVAEIYTKGGIEASSPLYREDGLLQAGILNFAADGSYIDSTPIQSSIIANNYIPDPSLDMSLNSGSDEITIGGVTFTYSTAPTSATEFISLIDLVYAINQDATCTCTAELAPGNGGYALLLRAKTPGSLVTISGTSLDLLNYIGFSTVPPTGNIAIPLFGSDLVVDWASDTTPVAPTNAIIEIDGSTTKELKRQANFLTYGTNGSPFGEYDSWYIENGDLYMKFKNGAPDKKLYAIPVALFQAPQFLKREGGAYLETDETGEASIRLSGVYAGVVISKAIADSGSNPTEQLVDIVGMQQFSQMNATAMSINNKSIDEFLRRI